MEIVDKLWAIENIKQLKARYARAADEKDDEAFCMLLTEDVVWRMLDVHGHCVTEIVGRAAYAQWLVSLRDARQGGFSVHQFFMPEIEIIDSRNAKGIWPMMDYIKNASRRPFTGYGHYHEAYVRDDDDQWRIKSSTLTRLRVDVHSD